jgi:hypothetical protein
VFTGTPSHPLLDSGWLHEPVPAFPPLTVAGQRQIFTALPLQVKTVGRIFSVTHQADNCKWFLKACFLSNGCAPAEHRTSGTKDQVSWNRVTLQEIITTTNKACRFKGG